MLVQSVGFAQAKGLRWRRRVNVVTTHNTHGSCID